MILGENKPISSHSPLMLMTQPETELDGPDSEIKTDLLGEIIQQAEMSGCQFLFEIPGDLFEEPNCRAAALSFEHPGGHEPMFVLCDLPNQTVRVLAADEVSKEVNGFVASYINVLMALRKLEAVKQLH